MKEKNVTETPQTTSWKEKALKAAGYGYSVGDVSMGMAAWVRGGNKAGDIITSSLIWLAGGIAAAIYGHPSPEKQLEITSDKFLSYLKSQGVEVPEDQRSQNALLRKPSFKQKCEHFFYQHPSEMLNLAYGIGALFLLKKGVHDIRTSKKTLLPKFDHGYGLNGLIEAAHGISNDFWMGALISGGALSGLLIKEDQHAREKVKDGNPLTKAVAYVKEKPLRVTGTFYGLNNIFTLLRAAEDYRDHRHRAAFLKPHWFSGLTAGCYLASNALLTMVTRDRVTDKFSDDAITKLEDAAARVIASQPADKQIQLLNAASEFMAKQKGIRLTAPEIEQQLAARIARLTSPGQKHEEAPASFAVKETNRRLTSPESQILGG